MLLFVYTFRLFLHFVFFCFTSSFPFFSCVFLPHLPLPLPPFLSFFLHRIFLAILISCSSLLTLFSPSVPSLHIRHTSHSFFLLCLLHFLTSSSRPSTLHLSSTSSLFFSSFITSHTSTRTLSSLPQLSSPASPPLHPFLTSLHQLIYRPFLTSFHQLLLFLSSSPLLIYRPFLTSLHQLLLHCLPSSLLFTNSPAHPLPPFIFLPMSTLSPYHHLPRKGFTVPRFR